MGRKAKGLRIQNPDAFELFLFATAYLKGAAAMARGINLPWPYCMPVFVVEAFSVELHLKCLLRSERKLFKKGTHDIESLYKGLSPPSRRLIRESAGMSPAKLRSFFDRTNGIFQKLRYMHEGHQFPKVKKDRWGNFGTHEFVWAIRELLKYRHPDWEERMDKALPDIPMPISQNPHLTDS